MIMFNPSTGGGERDKEGQLKADKTINTILRAVDDEWFGEEVTGVHIRNLFSYRTPRPDVLINQYNQLLGAGSDEDEALVLLGLLTMDDKWKAIAKNCKYVIIGWGDC